MKNEFLEQLASLCEKHKAEFYYTNDDDGIHVDLDGVEVFADFMFDGVAASKLRLAKD